MIRRHALWFRALLMVADALLAVVLLVGLSIWRFGADWAVWWRQIVPAAGGVPRPLRGRLGGRADAQRPLPAAGALVHPQRGARRPARHRAHGARHPQRPVPVQAARRQPPLPARPVPGPARRTISTRAIVRPGSSASARGANIRLVLVLGAGPRGQAFAAKLEGHRELGLRVIGFLDDSDTFDPPGRWPRLGALDDLEGVLHERVVDEVAICLPFSPVDPDRRDRPPVRGGGQDRPDPDGRAGPGDLRRAGRGARRDAGLLARLGAGPGARPGRQAPPRPRRLGGRARPPLPVLLAVALAIALDDGRPVLFRQARVGLHGRPFQVVKFRSMTRDAEARRAELAHRNEINGRAFKVTDDPRVTRIGRFLRRTSLDELPQLWNVLRGEMSLVGPRPPLPDEVAGYDLWHRRRLSMKPGITGLWQVRGRREPDFDRWVEADLEYIDRWSLWLDLKILARTIPAALEGR